MTKAITKVRSPVLGIVYRMGRLAPVHGQPFKDAIHAAVTRGRKTTDIWKALEAGTLKGMPEPYPVSRSVVDYYVRQSRKRIAQTAVTKLAGGDASRAIDHLARQLISEAEIGIGELRRRKQRDPKAAKEWGDLLKTLRPLTMPDDTDKPTGNTKPPVPTDSLSARLLTADKTETGKGSETTQPATNNTEPQNQTTVNGGGVAAQVPPLPVFAA